MDCDLTWMIGRLFTGVANLGHGSFRFDFGEPAGIRADCPWRVICGGGIALSSEDDGQKYGLAECIDAEAKCRSLLGGSFVRAAEVRGESRDIVIEFTSGVRLEVIPLNSGYESWHVAGPGGCVIIAQGGGNLVAWHPNAEHPDPLPT